MSLLVVHSLTPAGDLRLQKLVFEGAEKGEWRLAETIVGCLPGSAPGPRVRAGVSLFSKSLP